MNCTVAWLPVELNRCSTFRPNPQSFTVKQNRETKRLVSYTN